MREWVAGRAFVFDGELRNRITLLNVWGSLASILGELIRDQGGFQTNVYFKLREARRDSMYAR